MADAVRESWIIEGSAARLHPGPVERANDVLSTCRYCTSGSPERQYKGQGTSNIRRAA